MPGRDLLGNVAAPNRPREDQKCCHGGDRGAHLLGAAAGGGVFNSGHEAGYFGKDRLRC